MPLDNRNRNVALFFIDGSEKIGHVDDCHSHSIEGLDMDGMTIPVLKWKCVQKSVRGEQVEVQRQNADALNSLKRANDANDTGYGSRWFCGSKPV